MLKSILTILKQDKENGITVYDVDGVHQDKTCTSFNVIKEKIFHVFGDVKNPDNWIKVEEN